MTDVQPLLDRVADELRTHGWCQGTAEDAEGRHCLIGALIAVELDLADEDAAEDEIYRRITPDDPDDPDDPSISGWNDAPGRTVEEVFALLAPR